MVAKSGPVLPIPLLVGYLHINKYPIIILMSMKRTISITEPARAAKRAKEAVSSSRSKRASSVRMTRMNVTTIRRSLIQSTEINQSVGITNGVANGFDLTISPALAATDFIVAGATMYQPVLPNASELTNLFDQYRIKKCYVELRWTQTEAPVTTSTTCAPIVHIANDYNSTGAFNSADMMQYPDLKTYQLGQSKAIRWSFEPRVRVDALTNGGVLSSSAFNTTGWLDSSSTNIQHLGTKVYFDMGGQTTNVSLGRIHMKVTYEIECRLVK